jgi:succinate-semialdehyde dehydrogenase/glutarate-semialdehyde dehydrogenase
MGVCGDEILGPVASVLRFKDGDEVIAIANNTRACLAAYFYTTNHQSRFSGNGGT